MELDLLMGKRGKGESRGDVFEGRRRRFRGRERYSLGKGKPVFLRLLGTLLSMSKRDNK